MSIGERISELRKQADMTQYELARIMDVSRQAVSKWESDQSVPDAMHLIHLADVLDSDIEYLVTGRRTYGRRPPVVIKSVETVEKIVEKPVYQPRIVEKVVEVPVVQVVEKPVTKKVYRTRYIRNHVELAAIGIICFLLGILVGLFVL